MITFKHFLIEFELPQTEYGYWITGEGEIIPVPMFGHDEKVEEYGFRSMDEVWQKGWIRVVTGNALNGGTVEVEYDPKYSKPKALSKLYYTVKTLGEYTNKFVFDHPQSLGIDYAGPSGVRQALSHVMRSRN